MPTPATSECSFHQNSTATQWTLSWSWILDAWESRILFVFGELTAEKIDISITIKYADFFGRNFMNKDLKFSYNEQYNHQY